VSFRLRRWDFSLLIRTAGVWIARIFIAANGGTIAARNPGPEGGTTVTIRFLIHEGAAAFRHVQVS
jgi:hypothetical protein